MQEDCNLLKIDLQLFSQEEKTEEPTPHKKRQVRREGQVARSNDFNAVINLLAVFTLLFFLHWYLLEEFSYFLSLVFTDEIHRKLTEVELQYVFLNSSYFMFKILAPIFVVGLAAGLAANFAQVGFMIAPKAIQPKLSNINPAQGFKRIFSKRAIVEMLKAVLKLILVGWTAFVIVRSNFSEFLFLVDMSVVEIVEVISWVVFQVAAGAIGIFLIIAVLDYIFQRYDFHNRIKMTKQEVKDEFKQTEGDPQIKSKMKERQKEMAQKRMMQDVPDATVVITNPTHIAVALEYESTEKDAPEVIAKGAGYLAERIIEIAEEHEIPVIENKSVAQILYKDIQIGEEIPPELYKAVAEILAMIYRLEYKK